MMQGAKFVLVIKYNIVKLEIICCMYKRACRIFISGVLAICFFKDLRTMVKHMFVWFLVLKEPYR